MCLELSHLGTTQHRKHDGDRRRDQEGEQRAEKHEVLVRDEAQSRQRRPAVLVSLAQHELRHRLYRHATKLNNRLVHMYNA